MSTDSARSRPILHIDWTRCDGRGVCVELLPELLNRDDWGYPVATILPTGNRSNVPISPALEDAAVEAVALCPRLALSLLNREASP